MSWNLEKLNPLARAISRVVLHDVIFEQGPVALVEVRLDRPLYHLIFGGEGVAFYGQGARLERSRRYGDPDWAVLDVIPTSEAELQAGREWLRDLRAWPEAALYADSTSLPS